MEALGKAGRVTNLNPNEPYPTQMKEYALALEELHESIDLSNRIDSLMKLAAIDVFCHRLDDALKAQESFPKADYIREKVEHFRSFCYHAITPTPDTEHRTSSQWLDEAAFNLLNVKTEL